MRKLGQAGQTYAYDADNKMTTYNGGAYPNPGANYYYDGDGRRVKKVVGLGPATTVFVYNAMGQLVAEYTNAQAEANGTRYLTSDTLGSPRAITNSAGQVVSRHDYLPFGEEIQAGIGGRTTAQGYVADNVRQKFTSQERDSETGLDYFKARYYSPLQGRFTSPDPSNKSMNSSNPQSWNRYSYCLDNPLLYVDPNGKWPTEWHRYLVRQAFPGLTEKEREYIHKGSLETDIKDGVPITLDPKQAHKHAQRQKGESIDVAERKMVLFIAQKTTEAYNIQQNYTQQGGQGLSGDALYAFGEAAHAIMDDTSPMHTGFQEYEPPIVLTPFPSISSGLAMSMGLMGAIVALDDAVGMYQHRAGESRPPTPEEEQRAVEGMRLMYLHAMGEEQYQRAITPPSVNPPPVTATQATAR